MSGIRALITPSAFSHLAAFNWKPGFNAVTLSLPGTQTSIRLVCFLSFLHVQLVDVMHLASSVGFYEAGGKKKKEVAAGMLNVVNAIELHSLDAR